VEAPVQPRGAEGQGGGKVSAVRPVANQRSVTDDREAVNCKSGCGIRHWQKLEAAVSRFNGQKLLLARMGKVCKHLPNDTDNNNRNQSSAATRRKQK
jgi:hypothetical protein